MEFSSHRLSGSTWHMRLMCSPHSLELSHLRVTSVAAELLQLSLWHFTVSHPNRPVDGCCLTSSPQETETKQLLLILGWSKITERTILEKLMKSVNIVGYYGAWKNTFGVLQTVEMKGNYSLEHRIVMLWLWTLPTWSICADIKPVLKKNLLSRSEVGIENLVSSLNQLEQMPQTSMPLYQCCHSGLS